MTTLHTAVNEILDARRSISDERSVLIAISGIDASGKGYFTERLVSALQTIGVRAVSINVDAWLSLPDKRFGVSDPPVNYTITRSASRKCSLRPYFRYEIAVPGESK